ncbi:glutamate synthase domain-containing protein 2 [Desulfitispora alkaliphila]|uniref:FMN-binding glutamate synthase family protein n=1 Tax=Desulfitispora alkaliphila TaxID=622674 RepID=UPI003D194FCF
MLHKIVQYTGAIKGAITLTIGYYMTRYLTRKTIKNTMNKATKRIMIDKYEENLWEFVSASTKATLQGIVETNLRSEEGKVLHRPLGSPKKFPNFNNLMFNIAQLKDFPTPYDVKVDTSVIIGPKAKKPMKIDTPIMISGMACGLALSEKAKVAMAKGTAKVGSATNTGEGVFSSAERRAAKNLIVQYHRGDWNKAPSILKQGDMIEIQIGQGAIAGIGHKSKYKDISPKLRKRIGLKSGQDAVIHARLKKVKKPSDMKKLVDYLRKITGGVPIGVKMAAGKYLEKDMEILVNAGVDVIAIEGAEAATVGSAPIIQDDFGLPTLLAVSRAGRFMEKHNLKNDISLVVTGGLLVPGHFLKAIALGADAVYIGTAALFATAHSQVLDAVPFEPPTQVLWENGAFKDRFNVNLGSKTLEKFLRSCTLELEEAVQALGKTKISEVNKEDLFALDPETCAIAKVDLGYEKRALKKCSFKR